MTKDMQQAKNQPQPIELQTHKIHNGEISSRSQQESDFDSRLLAISKELLPQYGGNWGVHSLVTLKRMALSRVIYYYELYQKIIEVPGVICEFGVQWGATLALLQNLRGMYEPYNVSRKIIGFDTFEGFATVEAKDGPLAKLGDYKSLPNYEKTLEEILSIHEAFCPISHIKKFELIKGDASVTIDKWIEENPHAIISMAVFDMDVYKPTKDVLEKIIPRLTKGSLLVFDELNCQHFPGETTAVQEVLGLNNLTLKRFPHQSYCAWAVFGE
jgi:Macrocin-O-methyltransferase (TylF)